MAQILANTNLTDEQKKYVNTITDSGLALTNLINDILDFSKIEAGKLELDFTAFSLTDLCRDISLLFSSQLKNKNIKIELAIPKGEKHYIYGDHGRMRQILNNLVSNAVKFTQQGFVTIQIVHHDKEDKRHLYIAVIDSGIGISPENQKLLFKPFTQSGPAIAHKHGGTGLGLSICKKLVELMNGKIGVTSQYGKGATFWLELAFERAAPELVERSSEQSPLQIDNQKTLCGTILVAEDNETNQEVIRLMLTSLGLNVIIAENGLVALDTLQREHVDLIFMDCQMPVLDGFATTKRIYDTYGNEKRPPIIALTANAFSSDVDRCIQAGMDDFMSKPVDQNTLLTMLGKWLPGYQNPQATETLDNLAETQEQPSKTDKEAQVSEYIDTVIVDRLVSLSPEAFEPLKANFLQNTEKRLNELQEAITKQDYEAVERLAHSLKGSCATFGAKTMSAYAAEIEQSVKTNQLENITTTLPQLVDSFIHTRECFSNF